MADYKVLMEGPKVQVDQLYDMFSQQKAGRYIRSYKESGPMNLIRVNGDGTPFLDGPPIEEFELDMGGFGGEPGRKETFRTNLPLMIELFKQRGLKKVAGATGGISEASESESGSYETDSETDDGAEGQSCCERGCCGPCVQPDGQAAFDKATGEGAASTNEVTPKNEDHRDSELLRLSSALKAKGNAAFSSGKFEEAINFFSQAIKADPSNYVLYSNRSAALASCKRFTEALEDAEKTVELKPDWPKGYSRLGLACMGLSQEDKAYKAYKKGLELDPSNENMAAGMKDAESQLAVQTNDLMGSLFSNPQSMANLRSNVRTAPYLEQEDFMRKLKEIEEDPSKLDEHMMNDTRIMQALAAMGGLNLHVAENDEDLMRDFLDAKAKEGLYPAFPIQTQTRGKKKKKNKKSGAQRQKRRRRKKRREPRICLASTTRIQRETVSPDLRIHEVQGKERPARVSDLEAAE